MYKTGPGAKERAAGFGGQRNGGGQLDDRNEAREAASVLETRFRAGSPATLPQMGFTPLARLKDVSFNFLSKTEHFFAGRLPS